MIQLKQDPARDSARYTLVLLPARRPLLQAMQLGGEDGSEAELRQPARGARCAAAWRGNQRRGEGGRGERGR